MDETFCPFKNAISLKFFSEKECASFMSMQNRSQLFCENKTGIRDLVSYVEKEKICFCSVLEVIKKGFLLNVSSLFFILTLIKILVF